MYGDAVFDTRMMSSYFDLLQPSTTRDILFVEYLEELAAAVVGPTRVLRFFTDCFAGQGYRLTKKEQDEHHTLWRHK